MAKSKFIVIPTIKSFEILDYSLFSGSWNYKVLSGLNLLIGINGIGKTTTTNILSYALAGVHEGFHEKLDSHYFTHRISDQDLTGSNNTKLNPRVSLDLQIGKNSLIFTRSLVKDEILSLTINKSSVLNSVDLNSDYENSIKKFTGLESMDDLIFLISHLLIRKEEHNYILWNERDQSRAIRLLLNQTGFAEQFKALERELQDADSEYKREKDFMGKLEKLKKNLESIRDQELTKNKEFIKKEDLIQQIEQLKHKRNTITHERDSFFLKSEQLSDSARKNENEISTLKTTLDFNADEQRALESRHFHAAFEDAKSDFIFTKISQRNICIVCNNNVNQKKVTEVVKKVKILHECPVCSSSITNVEVKGDPLSPREIKRLEALSPLIKNTKNEISNVQRLSDNLFKEIEQTSERILECENGLRELNLNIALNQNKLEKLGASQNNSFTNDDFRINELKKEIDERRKVTEPLLKKFNGVKDKMRKKNEVLNSSIDKFNNELVNIFNSLSEIYFGKKCTLVINKRQPKGFEIHLSYFVPELNDKTRSDSSSVSKSEAIFLEYLFRFSLLKLYLEKTGVKPFLFLETSEGSFDINNTIKMAETLAQIGKIGFPFAIITNLSKIDFIQNLIPDLNERKKRTFNLINFAPESVIGTKGRNAINKALKNLKLA